MPDGGGEMAAEWPESDERAEHRRVVLALKESEARFRRVFEGAPIGICVVGADLRMVEVNPTMAAFLGYPPADLVGCAVADVTHPDDVELDLDLATSVFRGEIPSYRIEKRYIRRDGATVWGALTATVLRDDDGRPLYGLGMVEDVTERLRAEAALRESEARHRALSDQLRAALNTVKSLTGLLPICASCKKIRDDGNRWQSVEAYIQRHTDAQFTHSICPDCARNLYGDYLNPDSSPAPPTCR